MINTNPKHKAILFTISLLTLFVSKLTADPLDSISASENSTQLFSNLKASLIIPSVFSITLTILGIFFWLWNKELRKRVSAKTEELNTAQDILEAYNQKLEKKLELRVKTIHDSQKHLLKAQSIAHIGNITIDHIKQKTKWSDEIFHILALEDFFITPSLDLYLNYTHPSDAKAIKTLFREELKKGHTINAQHRILRKNGDVRFVAIKSEPSFSNNELLNSTITVQDITESHLKDIEIKNKEENFRNLFEQSNDCILVIDSSTYKTVDSNQKALDLLGIKHKKNIIGMSPIIMTPEYQPDGSKSQEKIITYFQKALKEGSSRLNFVIQTTEQKEINTYASIGVIEYNGKTSLKVSLVDLTEEYENRKKLSKALLISENALALAKAGTWSADFEEKPGIFTYNADLCKILGLSLTNQQSYDILIKDWASNLLKSNRKVGKHSIDLIKRLETDSNTSPLLEYQYTRHDDGEKIWIRANSFPERDKNGKMIRLQGIAQDITKEKEQEIKNKHDIRQQELIQDTALLGSWELDFKEDDIILVLDRSLTKIIGESSNKLTLTYWLKHIVNSDPINGQIIADSAYNAIYNSNATGWYKEYKYKRANDQKVIWLKTKASFIRNLEGIVSIAFGISQDITEAMDQKLSIEKEKEQSNLLLNSINEGIFYSDTNCDIYFANRRLKEMLGYKDEDLIGENALSILFKHKDKEHTHNSCSSIQRGISMQNIQAVMWKKDNTPLDVEYSAIPLKEGDKLIGLVVSVIDISQRLKTNRQLNILNTAIDQSPATVVITDVNSVIEYVNPHFTQVTGYTLEETIGQKPSILKSGKHSKEFYKNMWQTISQGKIWKDDICNIKKNGDEYWENVSISSIKDDQGKILKYIAVKEDITERKEQEKRIIQAKEEAESANRAKSAFLANMSHEIRTPMNSIIGFSEILIKRINEPISSEYLQSIKSSGKTLLTLINGILDFSKIEAGKFDLKMAPCNIYKVIDEMSNLFTLKAQEKGINFNTEIDEKVPQFVILDELRIKQVLINLVGNAIKFTSQGSVTISINAYENNRNIIDLGFQVKDTGIGIAKEEHERIFDAFKQQEQQDNRKYEGTGLGLSISNSLVQLMGSRIKIESDKGKGSNFHFTLKGVEIGDVKEIAEGLYLNKKSKKSILEQTTTAYEGKELLANKEEIKLLQDNCEQALDDYLERQSNKNATNLGNAIINTAQTLRNKDLEQLGADFLMAAESLNIELSDTITSQLKKLIEQ